ncbi:MAG: methionine--tRNA ligase [Deltaproteobacteria bacterium]|jgi:methionyl-tRNA synthetase|nr:methionine--tRNA ligase [Deltaproteobacteria bacterium]
MTYYLTTPIYYVNAKPHLGHAYTTIVCDTMTRFHKLIGDESYFLTGTDEHGDKIALAAAKEGLCPQDYVDYISSHFKYTWPKFNIRYDDFIRTTQDRHKDVVSKFLDLVNNNGDIYFGEYGGLYCVGCERFYNERELVDGLCPDHKTPPVYIAEKNYFFKMSNYQDWLIDHIKTNPDFIRPERYRNEVLSFLSEPLEDLCISRPKSRLNWGIDIPFDQNYVTYVWFDALINYITGLGWPDDSKFQKFWPYAEHCVAKDILKPHAIFWPTMLKSAGVPIYKHLNVHGYWQMDESKMSKSVGNVVDIFSLKEEFGTDALRYFLLREMNFGLDSEFSYQRIFERYNSDLANDFGNLWQRSITMLDKYIGGVIPPHVMNELSHDSDWELVLEDLISEYKAHFINMRPSDALKKVWDFVGYLNKLIVAEAPWVLSRHEETMPRLEKVMGMLVKGLALIAALISPVMPEKSAELWIRLKLDPSSIELDSKKISEALTHGKKIEVGAPLFVRAEKPEPQIAMESVPSNIPSGKKAVDGPVSELSIADFKKVDLRTALVVSAEPLPKSDKLIKLTVKIGDVERVIVAGIKNYFQVEELVGKNIVVVANLAPVKLMGIKSQGMVLCASGNDTLALLLPSRDLPPGSPIT